MKTGSAFLRQWALRALFSLLFSVIATSTFGQSQRGAISGNITDQSGSVLKGAQISIPAQNVSVVSDEQGRFFITDLASGSYSINVSYVGLETLSKTIEVTAGQTTKFDARLLVKSENQTVLVTAGRASAEAEAVNMERTADNIEQVLPAQVITSLPNANMADAVGRLPSVTLERDEGEGKYVQVRGTEPRLTNTTVDGANLPSEEPGVRQIKFDAIPAGLVDSVQISKTLEANMDGDGIGGSVNLVTKTATDTPTVQITSLGGYTPIINGRGNTTQTATLGKRFGASKKLGVLVGGSFDWEGRGIDDIEPVPDVATLSNGTSVSWKDAMDIREYQYFRSRWGLAGSADYRIADGSNIYARFLYSDFKNYGDRWAYTFTDNTPNVTLLNVGNVGCAPTTDSSGNSTNTTSSNCTGAPTFNAQLRNPDIQVGSLMLGGMHVLSSTWYSWYVSAGRASYGNSPYSTAAFSSNLNSSSCQYASSATKSEFLPQWNAECYAEAYNPANLDLNNLNRNLGHSAQLNLGVAGNGAWRYHLGAHTATIEYGGKFRNDHKFADTYLLTYTPNGTISQSAFPNRLSNTRYYNGGAYKLGYNVKEEDVLDYVNAHPSSFTASSTQGTDPSDYNLVEKVGAGYVMHTIDFASRVRWIVGLRAEVTTDDVRNLAFGDGGIVTPNAFSGSYYTLLPSSSLRFGVGGNSYLRLIYARGLSRPDEQDIAQPLNWSAACNGGNRFCVSFGNANLKAETGDDVDVLFDHYLSTFGVISAGYFYKSLHDPIVTSNYLLPNYLPPGAPLQDTGTYEATQPVNAGSAWISGIELNYLQHYSNLPGMLGGLGMSANYSYIGSQASGIPGRTDHPRLQRNSPNMFNLSPTYDRGRYSLRVGMSYNQANIYGYQYSDGLPGGVNGPLSDIYFYSHFQVDAQGSIGLPRGLKLIVSGLDLNNEVFGFYQGSPQYMIQREYYQPTISAGLSWSPARGER